MELNDAITTGVGSDSKYERFESCLSETAIQRKPAGSIYLSSSRNQKRGGGIGSKSSYLRKLCHSPPDMKEGVSSYSTCSKRRFSNCAVDQMSRRDVMLSVRESAKAFVQENAMKLLMMTSPS